MDVRVTQRYRGDDAATTRRSGSHIARWSADRLEFQLDRPLNKTANPAMRGVLCIRACNDENAITHRKEHNASTRLHGGAVDYANGIAYGDEFHDR